MDVDRVAFWAARLPRRLKKAKDLFMNVAHCPQSACIPFDTEESLAVLLPSTPSAWGVAQPDADNTVAA